MRSACIGLTLALAVLLAQAASAATVSVSEETEEEGTAVSFAVSAAPGEANRVTVTTRQSAGKMRTVVFRDAGAPLTPGEGCQAGAGGEVVCRSPVGDFANSVDVYAEDGDDSVDASAVQPARLHGLHRRRLRAPTCSPASRTRVNALFGDFVSSEVGDDRVTGGRGTTSSRAARATTCSTAAAAATRPPTATSAVACAPTWPPARR